MPLLIGLPEAVTATGSGRVLLSMIGDDNLAAARNVQVPVAYKRILNCLHCNASFCTGNQIIMDRVHSLDGYEFADSFLVRNAINLIIVELPNAISTASLENGACVALKAVSCQSCQTFSGFKVIGMDNPYPAENDNEIAVGNYILNCRPFEIP